MQEASIAVGLSTTWLDRTVDEAPSLVSSNEYSQAIAEKMTQNLRDVLMKKGFDAPNLTKVTNRSSGQCSPSIVKSALETATSNRQRAIQLTGDYAPALEMAKDAIEKIRLEARSSATPFKDHLLAKYGIHISAKCDYSFKIEGAAIIFCSASQIRMGSHLVNGPLKRQFYREQVLSLTQFKELLTDLEITFTPPERKSEEKKSSSYTATSFFGH